MKRYLFLIFLISTNCFGQCFKDQAFNVFFEKKLSLMCSSFPKDILSREVQILASGEFTLWQEDVERIKNLNSLKVMAAEGDRVRIKIVGTITPSPEFYSVYMHENVSSIDFSQGTFQAHKEIYMQLASSESLLNDISSIRLASLSIYGNEKSVLRGKFHQNVPVSIFNVPILEKVDIKSKSLTIRNKETGELINSRIETEKLNANDLAIRQENTFKVTDSLFLKNFFSNENVDFDLEASLNALFIENSKTGFIKPINLKKTAVVSIKESQLYRLHFSYEADYLISFKILKTKIQDPFETWPRMPRLSTLLINNYDLSRMRGSLDVFSNLNLINLNETNLSFLSVNLVEPTKLENIFLLRNHLEDIEFEEVENSKKISPLFSMQVDSKRLATKIQRTLNRRAVFFRDWF